jgi:hypothetical protein
MMKIAHVTSNLWPFQNDECTLDSLWLDFCSQDVIGQQGPLNSFTTNGAFMRQLF